MKTRNTNSNPLTRPNQIPADAATTSAGFSTKLSESAFYLIALATLLRESIGSQELKKILIPGRFVSYCS